MKETKLLKKMLKLVALLAFVVAVRAYVPPQDTEVVVCEMCRMAVRVVVPMLGQDTEDIENAVNKECQKEFGGIPFGAQKCKKFVDEKLDPIIHELENGTAPKDVCTKLKMC